MSTPFDVPVGLPAQPVSPHGRFFVNQTFHFETLRNAGYILNFNVSDILALNQRFSYLQQGSPLK